MNNWYETASTPAFDPMLTYFEKYYIGQLMDNKVDRKKCNFPISTWSFFERVLTGAQLSNNMIEAWHKPFHSDSGSVHNGQKTSQKKKEQTLLAIVHKFDMENKIVSATKIRILKFLISLNLILS